MSGGSMGTLAGAAMPPMGGGVRQMSSGSIGGMPAGAAMPPMCGMGGGVRQVSGSMSGGVPLGGMPPMGGMPMGGMGGMPMGGPRGPPPANIAAMPMLDRQSSPALPPGAVGGAPAEGAFDFMNKKNDAFDFVGDQLKASKRSL